MIKRVVLTTLLLALSGNVMSAQAQIFQSPNNNSNRGNFRNNFQQYLNNLQTEAREFRDSVKRDLDRRDRNDSFNNSRREDRIKQEVDDFKKEVDRLRDRFKDDKPIRDNITSVVRYRQSLENIVQSNYVGSNTRQAWSNLRPDLLRLERIGPGGGGYNQNNGGYYPNNNGGFYQNNGTYNPNYRW